MRYLRTYNKLFESFDMDNALDIEDILSELSDKEGFNVDVRTRRVVHSFSNIPNRLEMTIFITMDHPGHNGGLPSYQFIWKDVKETIFRIYDYYYSQNEPVDLGSDRVICSKLKLQEREKSPVRLFASGDWWGSTFKEICCGFTKEEDFNNAPDAFLKLGNYTRFEKIKILIK